jgi:aminotransferase
MNLKRSPTLELAARINRLRAKGELAWSLSTPSFTSSLPAIPLQPEWAMLTPARGLASLREIATERLFSKWSSDDHETLIVSGAKAGIFSALRALVPIGSAVLVISPNWPSYADLAAAVGLNFRSVQTDLSNGFSLDINEIDHLVKISAARAIILSNPNNPTGKIYSADELACLAEIAFRNDLLLIIDESFSDIIFDAEAWKQSCCPLNKNVVIINSFSKNLHMQGLRVGACLVPRRSSDLITTVHQTVMSSPPSLSQHVIDYLLRTGTNYEPDYAQQRQMAMAFVSALGWRAFEPQGAFYVFPEVVNLGGFRDDAAHKNVFLLSGETFGIPYGRHFRLCFGRPINELAEIFDLLGYAAQPARVRESP